MELALYHPELGYYRRPRPRVGYGEDSDFFTASTSGPVFGELVAAACGELLAGRDPGSFEFVELGAEPAAGDGRRGVLANVQHPFRAARTVGVGEPMQLQGRCIVFSNELLDAQTFDRFRFRAGQWRKLGVGLEEGRLAEIEMGRADPAESLPPGEEGQYFDAPTGSVALVKKIAAQPWTGLFVASDYGLPFATLASERPAGTARAYHRHRQSNDLLAQPGEQDLTCHVCWDWIATALADEGFAPAVVESQEAFFVHHAAATLAARTASEAGLTSAQKRSLMQLLHPAHLGQKFQVLHAWRGGNVP